MHGERSTDQQKIIEETFLNKYTNLEPSTTEVKKNKNKKPKKRMKKQ